MNGVPEFSALRSLYGPSSGDAISELVEAVDALAAAMQTLRTTPTRDGGERIAAMAGDLHRLSLRLVGVLIAEAR